MIPAKPDLYICHTAYQVLIALVRALRAGGGQALVLTASIPNTEALAVRLSCAFSEVFIVDETIWPGIVTGLFGHLRNRRAYEACPGAWKLDKSRYNNIYISNDWSVLGRYLQDCGASYILCEDTVGGTLDPDQHLLVKQRSEPAGAYQYWGDSPVCRLVESEDAARCTLFPAEKLTTFSKKELLHSLTAAEKDAVRAVFITQPLPTAVEGATLLLPRSFVQDGLMDQPTQNAMFRAVAAKYAAGPLFIKTHPRDDTDYSALFPGATVLDRTMPSEVLNFCLPFRFALAVTVQSWVLRSFEAADTTKMLTLDEALALAEHEVNRT